jgi:hypothetical protein
VDRTAPFVDAHIDLHISMLDLYQTVRTASETMIFMLIGIGLVRLFQGFGTQFLQLLSVFFLKMKILTIDFNDRSFGHWLLLLSCMLNDFLSFFG